MQMGTAVEDQDASWSHRRCPGVEESAVLQLTWLAVGRDGVAVRLGLSYDDTSAAGPEVPPSGGSTALVGSPGQHGQIQ